MQYRRDDANYINSVDDKEKEDYCENVLGHTWSTDPKLVPGCIDYQKGGHCTCCARRNGGKRIINYLFLLVEGNIYFGSVAIQI